MIKQECIGIPDMILLLMIFLFQKIKIKAEIVPSPGGAYFITPTATKTYRSYWGNQIFRAYCGGFFYFNCCVTIFQIR